MHGPSEIPTRGRPDRPSCLVRTAVVPIRFTVAERDLLASAAAEHCCSLSTLIRLLALGRKLPPPRLPRIEAEAYLALGRIGNNLNQIAHHLHRSRGVAPFLEFHEEVQALRQLLEAVRRALIGSLEGERS